MNRHNEYISSEDEIRSLNRRASIGVAAAGAAMAVGGLVELVKRNIADGATLLGLGSLIAAIETQTAHQYRPDDHQRP